eukprot:GFKZ01010943.1.p1 GENE.GFKZ01010943.1~~GFKZ01010943.1.p1  ORF type:complete len:1193 (-),score=152.41 GFKZ01010943.1:1029-4607(-)
MSRYAPSFEYLAAHPEANGKAFLSATNGFLPALPLPPLPLQFSKWHDLALQLPALYESGEWDTFIASLPGEEQIPLDQLSDQYLLRANLTLGAIAHAVFHVAQQPIPACILEPWRKVSERLGRPTLSLAADFTLYNLESLPQFEGMEIESPYTQARPVFTMTHLPAERNFIMKVYSSEHAARPLPRLICRVQNAVVNGEDEQLGATLVEIIDVLEKMTTAFAETDPRSLNKFSIDYVDWARSIDISGARTEKGERGGTGLVFPTLHLLDAFFCRSKYETRLGKMEATERPCLSHIHHQFISKVFETSTMDYLMSNNKKQLLSLFRRALLAFAGESGYLGKHRISSVGYLEMMFKVRRPATSMGTGQGIGWERRIWRSINRDMENSMRERVGLQEDWYTDATVKEVSPVPECNAFRIAVDGHGAFHWKPGDLLQVLPENREALVQDVLQLLNVEPGFKVLVKDQQWVRLLAGRGLPVGRDDHVELKMIEFLRYSKLQPFDRHLGLRLAQAMSISDSNVMQLLQAKETVEVKEALQLLKHAGAFSLEKLLSSLDEVFAPLSPRYYSIASHICVEQTVVEIAVGQVKYKTESLSALHSSLSICRDHTGDDLTLVTSDISSESSTENSSDEYLDESRPTKLSTEERKTKHGNLQIAKYSGTSAISGNETDTATLSTASLQSHRTSDKASVGTLTGTCSTYLQTLVPGDRLAARIVPKLDFHLPKDPSVPIIMIAHGTGFAPFRAFLREFVLQKQKGGTQRKKCWLILGVMSRHQIPFLADIEEAVCQQKVADLSLAISREDFELDNSAATRNLPHLRFRPARRKHITDLFEAHRSELHKLWQLVSRDSAHIFVCGKPNVEVTTRRALVNAWRQFAPKRTDGILEHTFDGTSFANSLCANHRLHANCYDSGHTHQPNATYSRAEVAQHRTSRDCWVIFRDGVYDISHFLPVHPGGLKLLLSKGGQDITTDFEVAHGSDNYRVESMLRMYEIGRLESFEGASEEVMAFMREWSEPLLAKVHERQTKFELNWNQFEEIGSGGAAHGNGAAGRYTKHREAAHLLGYYIEHDDPEIFELVQQFVCKNLGQQLPRAPVDVHGAMLRLQAARKGAMMGVEELYRAWSQQRGHAVLRRCSATLQQYVEVAAALQRVVERAARRSATGGGGNGDDESVGYLAHELERCVAFGVEQLCQRYCELQR